MYSKTSDDTQDGKMMRKKLVTVILAAVFIISGCGYLNPDDPVTENPTATVDVEVPDHDTPEEKAEESEEPVSEESAQAMLETLDVKGRAPKTGYDRSAFGPAWKDITNNGCDTRNDMLQRDLFDITLEPNNCIVKTGVLQDAFSNETIHFDRSTGDGGGIDIDHLVALGNSWQTGAQEIGEDQRLAFANDPINLLAVDAGLNRQKGDADAATWLPPNKAYRCDYVASLIAVKDKYDLWVTAPEKGAMEQVLTDCPNHPLPEDDGTVDLSNYGDGTGTVDTSPEGDESAPKGEDGMDPIFNTCKEAKSNGYGNYIKGEDPEYGEYIDGDSNGVACE